MIMVKVSICYTERVIAKLNSICNPEDLEGLKVGHDFEDLGEGDERILTLKDSRILDNEGVNKVKFFVRAFTDCCIEDELQNVEMAERERERKNNELKIKKREYTGYDDEEFADGQAGVRKSILAKYDEDLEGSSETVRVIVFRLRFSYATS